MAVEIELVKDFQVSPDNIRVSFVEKSVRRLICWSVPCSVELIEERKGSGGFLSMKKDSEHIYGSLQMELVLDSPPEHDASQTATLKFIDGQDVFQRILNMTGSPVEVHVVLELDSDVILFDGFNCVKGTEIPQLSSIRHVSAEDSSFEKLKYGLDDIQVSIFVNVPEGEKGPVREVLESPELLEKILSRVVGTGSKAAIKSVSSVNQLWRESTFKALQNQGRHFHNVTPYHPWWSHGDNFASDNFPLGYTLPISTAIQTESDAEDLKARSFLRLHGNSVVELSFTYTRPMDSIGAESFLEGVQFPNLHTLHYHLDVPPSKSTYAMLTRLLSGAKTLKCLNYHDYSRRTSDEDSEEMVTLPSTVRVFLLKTSLKSTIQAFLIQDNYSLELHQISLVFGRKCAPDFAQFASQAVTTFLGEVSPTLKTCSIQVKYPNGPYLALVIPNMAKLEDLLLDNVILKKVDYYDDGSCGQPNLKDITLLNCQASVVDKFFDDGLFTYPTVRSFSYRSDVSQELDLDEIQMKVVSNCLPNCVSLTVSFSSARAAAVGMAQVFSRMTQLRKLTLILNKAFLLGNEYQREDLDLILTDLATEATWEEMRRRPFWRHLDFTGITNLEDLEHLVIDSRTGLGKSLKLTEFVVDSCLMRMPSLNYVELKGLELLVNSPIPNAMASLGKRLVQREMSTPVYSNDSDASSEWEDDFFEEEVLWD